MRFNTQNHAACVNNCRIRNVFKRLITLLSPLLYVPHFDKDFNKDRSLYRIFYLNRLYFLYHFYRRVLKVSMLLIRFSRY